MSTWQPGDLATWRHQPRGGWGYVEPVPVEVVKVTPAGKVQVRAPLKVGGSKLVTVAAYNLEPRSGAACHTAPESPTGAAACGREDSGNG